MPRFAALGLKVHDETTQYDDFFEFLEERSYSMSYKMILLLSLLKIADASGECDLDSLAGEYARFYEDRLQQGLAVDRPACPYNQQTLEDPGYLKQSILKNPFEKFERKRFLYQCKDLNRIAFSTQLWDRLSKSGDLTKIKQQMFADLVDYYEELGGVPNATQWRSVWNLEGGKS